MPCPVQITRAPHTERKKETTSNLAALNSELSTLDRQLLTIASLLSAGEQTRYGDQQYGANRCRRQAEQETATEKAEPGEEPAAEQGPDQAEDHVGQAPKAGAASDFARQPPGNQPDDNPAKQRLLHHRHSHFLLRKRFSFKGWNRRPSPGSVSHLLVLCLPGFPACRGKVRMSGLCKVEMSGFIGAGRADGTGANCVEPARSGSVEGVARGPARSSEASRSRPASAADGPARAAVTGTPAKRGRSRAGAPAARTALEPQDLRRGSAARPSRVATAP